ncbi:MAG: bifunctional 5,10-methylenetetrahydrofolate dehydrogenase/5,10-methenyltetrahydrofolate cyclohydrolase [Candidatus Saccharibacteria bacterium]|nr:bifunctional 5,10-methylenetetrahydrofolate dehydrogenase/5,10-methenyltetrahydrofolate cyclohydrolase [Candidatus Saccharibacteria bacterium]
MKSLNGSEVAGFIKERQAHQVRSFSRKPILVIFRDSENPVIEKYVKLKQRYGEDIGVEVRDELVKAEELNKRITEANRDSEVDGIIVQLPLETVEKEETEKILDEIAPEKDVDGLGVRAKFSSATATAIDWLLNAYDVRLEQKKIALVGYGKLVGRPLKKMWENYAVEVFRSNSDLSELYNYDVIVTATGKPRLIRKEMIRPGCVIVDAGTASENGVLVGDVDDEVRELSNIRAITPKIGGVGPMTVAALFEHVIMTKTK